MPIKTVGKGVIWGKTDQNAMRVVEKISNQSSLCGKSDELEVILIFYYFARNHCNSRSINLYGSANSFHG